MEYKSAMRAEYEKNSTNRLFKPCYNWRSWYGWRKNISWFFKSFKYAAQRAKRGYSDYDLYDFGDYVAGMIACGLEDFSNKTQAYPVAEKDIEDWKEKLRRASSNIFQGLPDLEDFNYALPAIPMPLSSIEENKAWLNEMQEIYKDREAHMKEGLEWFKDKVWEIWW
jgi:hypothetical protein